MIKAALMVVFTLLFFGVNNLSAQKNITNDYIIVYDAGVADLSSYVTALDAANWEAYRLKDKQYELSFDNGIKIALKSATQLISEGVDLNITSYQTSFPDGYMAPKLKLLQGNVIGMEKQPNTKTKFH